MTSLVTGGSGFLGRVVVEHLVQRGETVVVAGRRPVPGVGFVAVDLARGGFVVEGIAPDVVYHLAGRAHVVPRTSAERELLRRVNVDGTHRLLASLEHGERTPRAIVFASSVSVYGRRSGELLDEHTDEKPLDAYGRSKRQAEEVLADWCRERGVALTVVRLPLVVGAGAPGNLGAMIRALVSGRYLGVGRGDARRSMVLGRDVAAMLPVLAGQPGVYHLTDGHHPSFRELETGLVAVLDRWPPRHLPLGVARVAAGLGDFVQRVTRRRMPFNRDVLEKMTNTLTFSDARVRRQHAWRPTPVLDCLSEVVGTIGSGFESQGVPFAG